MTCRGTTGVKIIRLRLDWIQINLRNVNVTFYVLLKWLCFSSLTVILFCANAMWINSNVCRTFLLHSISLPNNYFVHVNSGIYVACRYIWLATTPRLGLMSAFALRNTVHIFLGQYI